MIIWRSESGGQGRGRRNKERSGDEYICIAFTEWEENWDTQKRTAKTRQRREIGKGNHQF